MSGDIPLPEDTDPADTDPEDTDQDLLDRVAGGDSAAACNIVRGYSKRLVSLCRSRISGRIARRIDPEDVVQSAFGSFFRQAADRKYSLDDEQPLWNLLATITINKLRHRQAFHLARKRSVEQEESLSEFGDVAIKSSDEGRAVELLLEELEAIRVQFEPRQREIVVMKLEGRSNSEIAAATGRTDRTVRLVIEWGRVQLDERRSLSLGDA